jgi:mono/diheme cytochrome c family protein
MRIAGRILAALFVLVVAALLVLYWLGTRDDAGPGAPVSTAPADPQQQLAYGAYLARVGDCMACHTARGGKPYAGGALIPTPFGNMYGPNITPDPDTGIGRWSEDDFWHALHNGRAPGGMLLYPAFPYTEYTHVSRADADALYVYLRSLPAVRQENRPHELRFPYDQRILLAAWRALYFRPGDALAAARQGADRQPATEDAQRLRGRYLVDGLGHCIACHAGRNSLGAIDAAAGLRGGQIFGLDWYAPPLDGSETTGMGDWSTGDIAALLKTGISMRGAANGPMGEVVSGSTQYLTDADAHAIAVYLKSLPAGPVPTAARAPSAATMERGGKLYGQFCAQCHQDTGKGVEEAWPPLAGNISVTAPAAINTIRAVLQGGFAPATAGDPQPHGMPPFAPFLNDEDVAAVVTYIRNSWGNAAGGVTGLMVKNARSAVTAE